MPESGGDMSDASDAPTQPIADNPRVRAFFSWISGTFLVLAILSFLAPKLLPQPLETAVSTILLDAMAINFILVFPALEVILWKLFSELPKLGYWGCLFLLLGAEILLPIVTTVVYVSTFLPALSPPMPLILIVATLVGGAFVLMLLGLAIVFVDAIREITRLFRDRRQPLVGDEP